MHGKTTSIRLASSLATLALVLAACGGTGTSSSSASAAVLGGAVLGGGRGSIPTTIAGALTLQALFTLLNLYGFPTPIRDSVQGLIIIGAVAYASYRLRGAR